MSTETETVPAAPNQVPVIIGVSFLGSLAQFSLAPIIGPLSREIGLAEWQVGLTMSLAAVMVVLTSQGWGRRSQSWGRKPVLVTAMAAATASMALFTLIVWFGMVGMLTGVGLFLAFAAVRGLAFGAAVAAVPPTAQAYVADVTTTEAARVKGMAAIGAAQGMAMVVGAFLGGALAIFGLLLSLAVVPVLLLVGTLLAFFALRSQERTTLIAEPARVSPFDPRVLPFLVAGFGMFTALGFVQVISGFIAQDRFLLDSETAGALTGGALLAAGLGMVFAQLVVVPRSGWRPRGLLAVGTAVAASGFVVLAFELGMVGYVSAVGLIGLGLGVAVPGYTAGPTLRLRREEYGGVAGLIGATNGLTFVVAPVLSSVLYGIEPLVPIVVGGAIMLVVFLFVLLAPAVRQVSGAPARGAAPDAGVAPEAGPDEVPSQPAP